MRLLNSSILLSASDLQKFIRCEHLTQLDLGWARRTLRPLAPPEAPLHSQLLARKGTEIEKTVAAGRERSGKSFVEIARTDDPKEAAQKTIEAMQRGVEEIYQAAFFDENWIGFADLLIKVEDGSYEALDIKMARSVRPTALLQLSFYSDQLRRIQGRLPTHMHLQLGSGERVTFLCSDFDSYYRRVRSRLGLAIADPARVTGAYPIDACAICNWQKHCWIDLQRRDHLSNVAFIRRANVRQLEGQGIGTLSNFGGLASAPAVPGVVKETLEKLHAQARLQLSFKTSGKHSYEFLEAEEKRGFQALPQPSPGDLFLDLEADPYAGNGLTYLFGLGWKENEAALRYEAYWADSVEEEKRAFERVVDFIVERRKGEAGLHVYHYGALDKAAMQKLSIAHGTREEEMDDLVRNGVFEDLYNVVRQAVRISQPSYSLKKVEAFYFQREELGVFEVGGPILAYEEWLETGNPALREIIQNYNREDCLSTVALQQWLLKLREEYERGHPGAEPQQWYVPEPPKPRKEEELEAELNSIEISRLLTESLPTDKDQWSDEHRARWLLGHLLHYHRREEKPVWWAYFDRAKMTSDELIEDREAIGGLRPAESEQPFRVARSLAHPLSFPAQPYKLAAGDDVHDPTTQSSAGTIERIDDEKAILWLRRGENRADPLPEAVIPGGPYVTKPLREALRRYGQSAVDSGLGLPRAATDILRRNTPRVAKLQPGEPLQPGKFDLDRLKDMARRMERSYLFVQGPPGSGKTYNGARVIVDLLGQKKRIGVTSNSHKAIHNLLDEVEDVAKKEKVSFRGMKWGGDYESPHGFIENPRDKDELREPDVLLVAGTAWVFADEDFEQYFDYVFIDEAGQVALANAIVIATAARNVVLLGDPLQLAQVSKGVHPGNAGISVLEHLLGSDATVPPERGMFIQDTRRMHPDVCRFVSELIYEGRLESFPDCARQRVESTGISGTGLRFIGVEHEGNSIDAPEEASRIAAEIGRMLEGGTFTNCDGKTSVLKHDDFMIVAAYNAQVRCIAEALRKANLSGVPVGTVDKFQGREAPVVFFSMATSSGEELPRDVEFLFSRNRLNVAISRARALAIVVASPRLLDVACKTPEDMRLVNALCRFAEVAK